jgi:hypothetical protein
VTVEQLTATIAAAERERRTVALRTALAMILRLADDLEPGSPERVALALATEPLAEALRELRRPELRLVSRVRELRAVW